MATQQEIGEKAEQLAQEYLLRLGYKILNTNYQYGHLELDIVAKDGEELVIVEVKGRSGLRYEHPSEAVTNSKIKRIVDAAEGYIQEKNWEGLKNICKEFEPTVTLCRILMPKAYQDYRRNETSCFKCRRHDRIIPPLRGLISFLQ